MENSRHAALYERVSTLEQAIEGYSLGAQDNKLKNYANYVGYEIFNTYIDDGYSGSSLNRPAMQKLINDIKRGLIDIVIIYKLDRLSRRVKDVLELVDLFEIYNVTLFSITENIDLSSPFGRAALKMAATFSELERENIIERTAMGRVAKAKSGLYSCPGRVPFGYNFDAKTKTFTINEEEGEIIKKLFELYISGYTFRKLFDYCKQTYSHPYFNNPLCCKPIIHRHIYCGYMDWKGELIPVRNVPPIISLDTFLKAQECIEQHVSRRTKDTSPYLLTGLIYCAKCGCRYCAKLRKHYKFENGEKKLKYEYRSYGCAARIKNDRKYYNHPICDNVIIDAQELEDYIISFISNIEITGFADDKYASGIIEQLAVENNELQIKKERLLDLFMDNIIDKDTLHKRSMEIENKIENNKCVIENEKGKISTKPDVTIDFIKQKQNEFHAASVDEKRNFLKLIIKDIIINDDDINIRLYVTTKK